MRQPRTAGVACATLTPMDEAGRPNTELLAAHCRWLLAEGCAAVVLLGTTGEANSFTADERMRVLEGVLGAGVSADRLMVGTGCCAIGDSVRLTRHALSAGVDRALMLPPFYYKNVSDAGVIEAYARTIDAIGDRALRLYLYRIPQLSGVDIGAVVIRELTDRYPGLVAGIKDSSGDFSGTRSLCAEFGGSLDVLVGSERYLLEGLAAGASGCVTATANANPALICGVYAQRGTPSASLLQKRATAARAVFESFPVIPALKEFTARRTGDARWRVMRPPLVALAAGEADALAALLV